MKSTTNVYPRSRSVIEPTIVPMAEMNMNVVSYLCYIAFNLYING